MSFPVINVGTTPNDGTGDVLRDAFITVNDNFQAVSDALDDKATATSVTAETAARVSDIATLTAEIATKQDAADGAVVDENAIHFNAAETLTNTEKDQHALNAGLFVTIPFQLIPYGTTITTQTLKLVLPDKFFIHDIFLTVNERVVGSGGSLLISYSLDQGATTHAYGTALAMTGTGRVQSTAIPTAVILGGTSTNLVLTVTNTETGSPIAKGLILWLRGHFAV